MNAEKLILVPGSCHCRTVTFEAWVPLRGVAQSCNCSLCSLTGYIHLIVPGSRFRLLTGESSLITYRFNTGTARHLFCGVCGIKSFYVPRSNPDGYSLNLNCLELPPEVHIEIEAFDGRHWEQHAAALRDLSRPD